MKGFIEVTARKMGSEKNEDFYLTCINVAAIVRIVEGRVFLLPSTHSSIIQTTHTYEELKAKIEESIQ